MFWLGSYILCIIKRIDVSTVLYYNLTNISKTKPLNGKKWSVKESFKAKKLYRVIISSRSLFLNK